MNEAPETVPYSRGEQRAWYLYDFANSAFSSTVVTLFLGPYLTELAKAGADAAGFIYPLGIPVESRSYWSYLIALSVMMQVIVLPVLGSLADYSARKKQMLAALTWTGAGATIAMFSLEGRMYLLGGALFLTANLAFGGAIVLYNAFLPDIAPAHERDRISSTGWGLGYLGGGLLLLLNLLLYQNAARIGISEGFAVRISLGSAGVWWAVFAIFPLTRLRQRQPVRRLEKGASVLSTGFLQLFHTLQGMRKLPMTLLFLVAFMVYNDAIQAVISLSGQFGSDYLKMPMGQLTLAILMVQFVAMGGALIFDRLARWMTAKRAVLLALIIWTGLMIAMFMVKTASGFFMAAAVVAIVMGGSQALSRSLFSLMIPKGREAEYFSLYEISDKGTSWLAPLLFGLTLQFTGSYQWAILSLIIFFLLGFLILWRVDVKRAIQEAGNVPPE